MEIWKDIEGYEGLYQVSNEGRVKSLERTVVNNVGKSQLIKERILRCGSDKDGYLQVCLCANGKPKNKKIHRLIAEAFVPNPDNKPCIDHINTIKTDNSISNLRWCTAKENNNNPNTIVKKFGEHISQDGRRRISEANRNNERMSKKVYQYTLDGELVKEWLSLREAERNGFNHALISKCCRGKKHTHKGFKWSYEKK